jgi:hypothetical protein
MTVIVGGYLHMHFQPLDFSYMYQLFELEIEIQIGLQYQAVCC